MSQPAAPALPAELVDALRGLLARHGGSTAQVNLALHLRGAEVGLLIDEPGQVTDRRGRFVWRLTFSVEGQGVESGRGARQC